ncbi:hypothetical protein Acr_13g0011860 [Actinidia rufa]|uniref:Uncharacterized protein n=1 Tax=Actinidia rufa TaxID=165716 RepID=A0A7J0FN31_9ERIC|nr:hypothetical protein Acr_13g0011860 [Actinidia rufa]
MPYGGYALNVEIGEVEISLPHSQSDGRDEKPWARFLYPVTLLCIVGQSFGWQMRSAQSMTELHDLGVYRSWMPGSASFLSIYLYCRGDNIGKTMAGGSGEGAELGRKRRLGMMMDLEWV